MKKIVIFGAGGDGLVLAEAVAQYNAVAQESSKYELLGFLDDAYAQGATLDGFHVLGSLESWSAFDPEV